jgi:2'-5' RNA ligase
MAELTYDMSGIGIFPPAAVATQVNRWRRDYDYAVDIIAPHITVAYPPFIPQQEWELVRPQLAACVNEFEPFDIILRTTNVFEAPSRVLWLVPENGGCLPRIYATLEERFPQYIPPSELAYMPHMTLGFFDTQEAQTAARTRVESELSPMQFHVTELVFMVHARNAWVGLESLQLGTHR